MKLSCYALHWHSRTPYSLGFGGATLIKVDSHGAICSDNLLGLAESHRVLLRCTSRRCEVVTTSMAYKLSLQIAPCELAIKTDSHGTICKDNLLGLAESHSVNGKIVTTFVGQTELLPCTSRRCEFEVVTTSMAYKLSLHIAPCELALSFIKQYTVSESFTNKTNNNNNNNRCHNVTSLYQLRRKTTLYDVSHKDGLFFFS